MEHEGIFIVDLLSTSPMIEEEGFRICNVPKATDTGPPMREVLNPGIMLSKYVELMPLDKRHQVLRSIKSDTQRSFDNYFVLHRGGSLFNTPAGSG